MNNQNENIELLASNFNHMEGKVSFMKEEIMKFSIYGDYPNINFKQCHVAISKNGGLIGVCKKKGYLDIGRGTKLNTHIMIMFQNAKKRFYIPISWDYSQKWIVHLDFSEDEKLYGLCNDGTLYKFDILTLKEKEKANSQILKEEHIEKVKFIEKGFVALTSIGCFYFVKDIKDPEATSLFPMNSLLSFSNYVDFLVIPPTTSASGNVELLLTNLKGNGVIHAVQQKEGTYSLSPVDEEGTDMQINGVSIILDNKLEKFIVKNEGLNNGSSEGNGPDCLGPICALAISPSGKQIAFYNNKGIVFFFDSKFEKPRVTAKIEINKEMTENEIGEQQAVISYKEGYQFLFIGEDAVALSGQRFIFVINSLNKTLVYKIYEFGELDAAQGALFSKCISEVDGLRFITNEGIFFISKVPEELFNTCDLLVESPSKKLLKAYESDLMKTADCDEEIRNLMPDLINAVKALQIAAANIYWLEIDPEGGKKDIQMYMIKGAQHGKIFIKDEFNYNMFNETCKEIRIINALRNEKEKPRLITYNEFKKMNMEDLIKKLLNEENFSLAFQISEYLDYDTENVFIKFAIASIKKLPVKCGIKEELRTYEVLKEKLKMAKNISFIKLAKKAFKYGKNEIGMKFLEQEKSILVKIPQYIEHKTWDKALELSYETFDSNVLATVIEQMQKSLTIPEMIKILSNYPKVKFSVVDYLQKNYPSFLETFLNDNKNIEDLFFLNLDKFFKSKSIEERRRYIKIAKEYEKLIVDNNSPTFDHKFYKSYLNELDYSLKFKKECMDNERKIIPKNDIGLFDNSIYDCFKKGIKQEQSKWIEKKNNDCFELSKKKMSILKIRTMAEKGNIILVDKFLKENSLKKLNLTPLNVAELYIDYKQYDKAMEYIKQINDPEHLSYKVEMLKYMEKYTEALEVIISDKNNDRIPEMVNDILRKEPTLVKKVEELCNKYRVSLK